jgi:TrmH family RNA methyltransferase
MSRALYDNLAEKTNPSEMFITVKIKPNTLDDIRSDNPFLLVFDRPSDYGNLGSIIRSANAFHVDGIYILGHGIDVYESKVMRASLGSIFFTKIVMMESMEMLEKYIRTQKMKNNIEIVGTDSTGIASIGDCKISRPVMVIIGNEAKGMSIKLKALCDRVIRIPMEGNIDSLNVSCAASIVLWEIYKNKNGK